jgi:hypothetical protein
MKTMKTLWPLFGFFGLWVGAMAAAPRTTIITPRDEQMFKEGAEWACYVQATNYDAVIAAAVHGQALAPMSARPIADEAFRQYIAAQP